MPCAAQLSIRKSVSSSFQSTVDKGIDDAILSIAEDGNIPGVVADEIPILQKLQRFSSVGRMFVLQNYLEHGAGQFRLEFFIDDKLFVYETDLDRSAADLIAQHPVSALRNGWAHYLHDVITTRLERLDPIP